MRVFVLLVIMLLLDVYVYQAVRFLSQGTQDWLKWLWRGSFWISSIVSIILAFFILSGYTDKWPRHLLTYVRTFLFIFYVSKLVFGLFILIDDLRRIGLRVFNAFSGSDPYDLGRSRFLTHTAWIIGLMPFSSLVYGMWRNPYRYRVYPASIHVPGLEGASRPLRIVQISDIHSGSFTFKAPVENAIDMINDLDADLVFFTGDLVNSKADEMEPFMDIFSRIRARYGVYSVLGNHDYGDYASWPDPAAKAANLRRLKDIHREMGWDLLLNEHRCIDWEGKRLCVAGVENYSALPQFQKYGDLAKATEGAAADLYLLLSHDPTHWDAQVTRDFPQIGVTFSGHTHGFQFGIEIPGFLRWSPSQYVYKHWAGLYRRGAQYLYVNRGLGFLGYPGRVGILPEISLIELRSGN